MKTTRIIALAVLIASSGLAPHVPRAQQTGIKRTDLQRHDLSVPGREVIQVLVEFAPGVLFPKHSHPGEEIVYVVEGLLEYTIEGRPPVTLKAGEVLFIPAGTPHAVTKPRQRHRGGACHVYRREREAAPHGGQVRRQGGDPSRCRDISSCSVAVANKVVDGVVACMI